VIRTSLIFTIVATFAVSAVACFSVSNDGATSVGPESWTARMGWRYVAYVDGDVSLSLSIEPMVEGDDRVYVPNEASWLKEAPSWTRERRAEVLSRLKSVAWNRKLTWQECECPLSVGPHAVIRGSLESTPGGRALEDRRLFETGSRVKHEQAHDLWNEAARMFAGQASGTVTIFMSEVIPDSVFQAVELPALKKNPNVTLVFK
jgi:hypothetical protein